MKPELAILTLIFGGLAALAQDNNVNSNPAGSTAPIYRVTVVQRSTKAINYRYRSGPTMIDFQGTVLLPKAKGTATVQSRQGRTEIDAKFDKLAEPQRFGREYLTYVLWALTPDGRPHNLGEVVADGSDKAQLRVTTDLQAFALIVTAEPYSAVRRPTDVVVLENMVRDDTTGNIEEVRANYELLPRGQYMWNVPPGLTAAEKGPKVSMSEYEMLTEIYQAQNAVGIAKTAHAEQYAPNTLAKAEQLLTTAQQLHGSKGDKSSIIQNARQAAETAEDAWLIAEQRQRDDTVNNARAEIARAQQQTARAEDEARVAKSQAEVAQAQADAERVARERAESDAAAARRQAAEAQAQLQVSSAPVPRVAEQADAAHMAAVRARLLEELNAVVVTRDTPRGLVLTLPDANFRGNSLSPDVSASLSRIGSAVAAHPGLRVEVEGHTDSSATASVASSRAEAVREELVRSGVARNQIAARGLGDSHPLGPNASASGREQNRRVEIVISGDPIGDRASWDHTYSLTAR